MTDDSKRHRAVWWLWFARGLGYGGVLLVLLGLFAFPIAPRLYLLGIALVLIALAIGTSTSRRLRKIREEAGRTVGGADWAVAWLALGLALALAAPFLLSLVVPFHVWSGSHGPNHGHKPVCLSNTKNLALAVQMYLADNDDIFPAAEVWCDALFEYTANEEKFQCPSAPDLECAYAFNKSLDGASMSDLADPVTTVAIFESDVGWNAAGDARHLPAAPRHFEGDHYAFADGHAQWISREALSLGETDVHWSLDGED